MLQYFYEEHWNDADGNPGGGVSTGTGVTISWQNGPLGRGEARKEPNGAFVETIIAMAIGRLDFYQDGRFNCAENAAALGKLHEALSVLESRTRDREARAVEGVHAI